MENNCIAVIYEGNKTERILIENLKKIFFLNRANIVFCWISCRSEYLYAVETNPER